MRVVVTGASGNVGTALIRSLVTAGHEATGICRRIPASVPPYDGASWVACDLTDPEASSRLSPAFVGADAVVHLAWGFQPARDKNQLARLGVDGTRAVVQAVRQAGVGHLVHMSSLGVYAPAPRRLVDESWPTTGIGSLAYSQHKVAAERLLDRREQELAGSTVTRMRPGLILQRDAGSALLRYSLPPLVPAALLRHVPVLPLDRRLAISVVHADDVADAIVRVLERRAGGAFNLATEPPLTRDLIAEVLGTTAVQVPIVLLRALAAAAWRLRILRLDPGWIDLAASMPLLDTTRAHRELEWRPRHDARAALTEVVNGMADSASTASPILRRRSVPGELTDLISRGPVSRRSRP